MEIIPKGTKDTWGIGIMETLWKVVEAFIDTCICASLQFHDILHGFRSERGTREAIMDLKLAQELASVDTKPPFLVFLDLWKTHDTIDRDCLIPTLEGYGAGNRLFGLLGNFWSHQKVVPIQNSTHGPAFSVTRGNAGWPRITNPLQRCCGKCNSNMVSHDSRGP